MASDLSIIVKNEQVLKVTYIMFMSKVVYLKSVLDSSSHFVVLSCVCFYVTGEKCALICRLCGVGFNSAKQAESHYSGQKHRSRETELKVGLTSVPIGMYHLDQDAAGVYSSDNLHYSCMSASDVVNPCLLYTSPSPRDRQKSRMPSSA